MLHKVIFLTSDLVFKIVPSNFFSFPSRWHERFWGDTKRISPPPWTSKCPESPSGNPQETFAHVWASFAVSNSERVLVLAGNSVLAGNGPPLRFLPFLSLSLPFFLLLPLFLNARFLLHGGIFLAIFTFANICIVVQS